MQTPQARDTIDLPLHRLTPSVQQILLHSLHAQQQREDASHDIDHLVRVWRNCQRIVVWPDAPITLDNDALLIAVCLHDAINLPKDSPDRQQASQRSAEHARQQLQRDVSAARLDVVCHAIEAHSYSARIPARTPEAQVLQDADRLDALGAVGIARCIDVGSRLGRRLFDLSDPQARYRLPDDSVWTLDHFRTKLFAIADTLHTDAARALARQRVAFMQQFLDQLDGEVGTSPP